VKVSDEDVPDGIADEVELEQDSALCDDESEDEDNESEDD
jgi:hypothetical protein